MSVTGRGVLAGIGLSALLALSGAGAALGQGGGSSGDLETLQTAHGLLGRGLFDLAAKEYRSYLSGVEPSDDDDYLEAAYGLALALHELEDPEGALRVMSATNADVDFAYAAELRLLRGTCLHEVGEDAEAARALGAFLRDHGEHRSAGAAAVMRVESLARLSEHRDVVEAAGDALGRELDGGSARRVRLLKGIAHEALGERDAAVSEYERISGASDDAALRLARLYEADQDERAGALYERAAGSDDGRIASRGAYALARRARERGDAGAAAGMLREWLETWEENDGDHALSVAARVELGRSLLDMGEPGDAAGPLGEASRLAPDDAAAAYWLAKSHLASGDAGRAAEGFRGVVESFPDDALAPYAGYDLAVALEELGEFEAAAEAHAALRERRPRHVLVPYSLHAEARLAQRRGAARRAVRLAERLLNNHAAHRLAASAGLILAEAHEAAGDVVDAARAFERSLEEHPEFDPSYTRMRLGLALREAGESGEAEAALEDAARGADADARLRPAVLALVDLAHERGAWGLTVERAERFLSWGGDQEGAGDAALKAGLALAEMGEHEAALRRFNGLVSSEDRELAAHALYGKASSLLALGRTEAAEEAYETLLAREAGARFEPFAQRALGAMALGRGDAAEAARRYAAAGESGAADPTDALNLAQALLASGDAAGALGALETPAAQELSGELAVRRDVTRAVATARAGDARSAARQMERLLGGGVLSEGETARLLYERALALRELGDDGGAGAALGELVREHADSEQADRARLELAAIAMESDELGDAVERLDGLLTRERELEPAVLERARYRRGVCAHLMDDAETAARLLGVFAEAYPSSGVARSADLIGARALQSLGRYEDSVAPLERVVASEAVGEAERGPALLMLAEACGETQRFDRSLEAARAYLREFGDSELAFRARFAEGWALENLGERREAIAAYREAAGGRGGATAARAQFQIGECLFALGEHEEAASELMKVDILHDSPEWSAAALYEAGRCFEALGKMGEARARHREVVERFPESDWAGPARERLSALTRAATPGRGD